MRISVFFSISSEDDDSLSGDIASNHEALLGDWADCEDNGESAVRDICEDYFDEFIWADLFGSEATGATVIVEVHSPATIAGIYDVPLERVVKAHPARRSGSG